MLLAALINACTARSNARLQARITQRIKRADFRQNWINALRESFIAFQKVTFPDRDTSVDDLVEHTARIMLLMNRSDPQFGELQQLMDRQLDQMRSAQATPESSGNEFMMICQGILKREWEVTKQELAEIEKI